MCLVFHHSLLKLPSFTIMRLVGFKWYSFPKIKQTIKKFKGGMLNTVPRKIYLDLMHLLSGNQCLSRINGTVSIPLNTQKHFFFFQAENDSFLSTNCVCWVVFVIKMSSSKERRPPLLLLVLHFKYTILQTPATRRSERRGSRTSFVSLVLQTYCPLYSIF